MGELFKAGLTDTNHDLRPQETGALVEGPGMDERGRAFAGQAPVFETVGLMEFPCADVVGHTGLPVTRLRAYAR
jgi:hypothetical protein